MSTVIAGVPSNIASLTGPMLIGNLFGYCLFGILMVQMFIYYYRFPRDHKYIKILVWSLFFLDVFFTVLATIAAWNQFASGWGDVATLAPLDWPNIILPAISGLIASMVHFFFAWRIWKLHKSMYIPIAICLVSLVSFCMATYCGSQGQRLGTIRLHELKPWVIVWLGGSALADILITASMVSILFKASSSTAFQDTSAGINRLITLTVETGMATSVGAVVEIVLFLVFPENNMHFLLFLILSKLYSNTLLATLNSRAFIGQRNAAKPALWQDVNPESGSGKSTGQYNVRSGTVQITTTTERREDHEMFVIEKPDSQYDHSTTSVKPVDLV